MQITKNAYSCALCRQSTLVDGKVKLYAYGKESIELELSARSKADLRKQAKIVNMRRRLHEIEATERLLDYRRREYALMTREA